MFESIQVAVRPKTGSNTNDSFLESTSTGAIISSDNGQFGATYDIEYRGAANYMNSIKNGDTRKYSADVVYTITAS